MNRTISHGERPFVVVGKLLHFALRRDPMTQQVDVHGRFAAALLQALAPPLPNRENEPTRDATLPQPCRKPLKNSA